MLFTQTEFLIFFAAVLVANWLLAKSHRAQKLLLLGASYYFYGYWDVRFLSLIFISTLIDYSAGLCLARTSNPAYRKALLILSLVANLSLLGFFKYFNFFVASLAVVLTPLGVHTGTLNIILPIGISFYTFQTLSYTIDVYRGKLDACHDFWDFALFVAFFPQLVAGPIVRASDFLPQLKSARSVALDDAFIGFRELVLGFFKKVFIADRLAGFVDDTFANAGAFDSATTWLSVACYAIQIYCDFSGYSDMAIGTARLLGYRLCKNFDHPYISTSITEFWRRWHISLSTWLRDYLYIPLGGNRKGTRRTYINLLLTMVLGGLWHGAAWTFVVWGALHGLALAIHKAIGPWLETGESNTPLRYAQKTLGWVVTMLIVLVCYVFFRSQTFGQAMLVLRQMFLPLGAIGWYQPFAIGALVFMGLVHGIHATRFAKHMELHADRLWTPVILFTLLWLTFVFYPKGFAPFIYFQF